MLHFDENEFDHDLSGYVLEATHLAIDCRDCHKPDYIDDPDLQDREKTYLGLDQECLSCHADFHQESLSSNCIECHSFEKFRPAPGFDHDESAFALNGKHIDVDCIECHPTTFRNGEDFQVFSGIEFNDCVSCHEDPHANQLVGSCSQCHSEESFSAGNALGNFNHNTTAFQLRGSHQNINCFECHDKTSNPKRVFQDLFAVNQNDCVACHENTHAGRFGNECVECHRETKFSDLRSMDLFDHQVTDFELEGLHVGVDCKSCHAGSYLEPIDFSACQNCHEDYHNGEFEDKLLVNDCGDCHTVFQDFTFTTFTVEKHEESSFPLDGSHLATPCFECHISKDRWTFREIGNECIDCHEDIHDGYISEKYYPEKKCNLCHNPEAWDALSFNHELTEWPLEGSHKETNCRECHFVLEENSGNFIQSFRTLGSSCQTCHDSAHGNQFDNNGVTNCVDCHDSQTWFPSNFDHNQTDFPLDGKHADLECSACHKPEIKDNEHVVVQYRIEKFACIDCHS
jgi:hypothetical protein